MFIPMADGVRLAATLYLPETPGPWPALLEAYPYRKDDISVWADDYRRLRDEGDYAVCRLDTRGTGSSDGVAVAEYPPGEADDLCAVIEWLAAQEWCTGAVGMFGTSYAGFATLHVGMRPPPAAEGDRPDLRDGRPLHRRHPLRRRRAQGHRVRLSRCSWCR